MLGLVRWERENLCQVLSDGRGEACIKSCQMGGRTCIKSCQMGGRISVRSCQMGEGSRLILVSWVGRQ